MSSIKLKHSGGNGVIIAAPSSNPASDKTLTLPSDVDGTIVSKDSSNSLQNITGINGGQLGNRNLIINGAMQVAQRGTSSTTSGYSTVDRFQVIKGGVDENPTQAQVDVASGTTPYNLGFTKALKVTNGNQTSGAGATDYIEIGHKIEAQNIRNSGWNYLSSSSFITLTFYVKSSVAQVFYGYLTTRDGTRQSYPFSTGSLSADTWTKVTKTIPGNSNLTFDNDNGSGLEVLIDPFYGTNYTNNSRSLDSWAAHANGSHFPDMTSTWYTTNDSTFEITGVQLEVGSTATDFEHRSFGQELQLCKRYYQPLSPRYTAGQYLITNEVAASTVFFNPEMRATPTVTHETLSCRENSDSFVNVSVSSNYNLTSKGINYVVTKTGAATSDSFIIFVNGAEYNAEL